MNDRLVLLETKLLQHPIELVRAEDAHEVVFKRQEELGMAGVALAARSTTQLVVNAAAFVPLGPQHEKTAGGECLFLQSCDLFANFLGSWGLLPLAWVRDIDDFLTNPHVGITTKLNVGAATGHVGRNRNRAGYTGLRDDIGFLLVISRIEAGKDFLL